MKYFVLCSLLVLFAPRGWAQRPAATTAPPTPVLTSAETDSLGQAVIKSKCKRTYVDFPSERQWPDSPALFGEIRVLDYRQDTSRIGVVRRGAYSQDQVVFRTNATAVLGGWLDSGYAGPEGSYSLLVVIKNLWISDAANPGQQQGISFQSYWNLAFRLEAFLQNSTGYAPLSYLDTLVHTAGNSVWVMAQHQLPRLSAVFMEKLMGMDLAGILTRKRTVTMTQIDSFSQRRFDYAMDTAIRPVKGVYANAEEFRDDRPSITDYQVTKDKQGNLELRVRDADGQYIYSHTQWGFCDGSQRYVMMDGNLFPVFRIQHQFYVLGSKEYHIRQLWIPLIIPVTPYNLISGVVTVNESVYRKLRLFRLNVRTGRVID